MKRFIILLLVLAGPMGAVWPITHEYFRQITILSDEILFKAQKLAETTDAPVFDTVQAEMILAELKDLIQEYEAMMVFAESPYPGEILLGTTPAGDSTWLETFCTTRYDGPLKEIRIRRTGHRARYLRINDIEITYSTPAGWGRETFNKNARVKLYNGDVFKLALPRPMHIKRIRIRINHESTGLEISGIPYHTDGIPRFPRRIRRMAVEDRGPSEVLLGTTPGGSSTWLETLCSNPSHRPIREIQLKRTGSKDSYIRINDIEITYLTPAGKHKEIFNKSGRVKLYHDGIFKLSLPRPMMVVNIRVLINHRTAGLEVYGVY